MLTKRDYTQFFTYSHTAKYMVSLLNPKNGDAILEPSAGNGALVRAVKEISPASIVFAIEIDNQWKPLLRNAGANIVVIKDFLEVESIPKFTSCIANPPFGNGTDLQAHFDKICSLVKSGGKIVMIVPKDFDPLPSYTEHSLENWATNKNGTTTPIKIIEFNNK